MKTFTLCFVLVTLLGLTTSGLAAIVAVQPCSNPDGNVTLSCSVSNVDIRPCREAARGKSCRISRAGRSRISFDFTPDFSGGDLQTSAYWMSDTGDIEFPGMNHDACASTTCPATAGIRQTYDYSLNLSRYYPKREYEVKWKLWNAEKKGCCFRFKIVLIR